MQNILTKVDALSCDDADVVKLTYDLLLEPKRLDSMTMIKPCSEPTEYLKTCLHNILVEYWCFLSQKCAKFVGWTDMRLDTYGCELEDDVIARIWKENTVTRKFELTKEEDEVNLTWNLVIYKGRFAIVKPNKIMTGAYLDSHGWEDRAYDGNITFREGDRERKLHKIHVFGFVKPFIDEIACIIQFLRKGNSNHDFIRQISMPDQMVPFPYCQDPICDKVPSNEVQRDAVNALQCSIEGIQGPPGTGKSTTIFHILNSRVPKDKVAIVTCVQNKAVDSIAEKLMNTMDNMPFFVIGNEKKLGPTAKQCTLKHRVESDKRMVALIRYLDRIDRHHAIFQKWFQPWTDEETKSMSLWERFARMNRVDTSDEDISEHFEHRRSKLEVKVTQRSIIIKKRFQEIQKEYVENARAVLGTIDTICNLRCSTDEDNANFIYTPLMVRISTAVIDEAGTVPEYKMPLLAALGVKCVVAIGDQNQLAPFSNARDDDRLKKDDCRGFFHRLAKARSDTIPMLQIQYRMHSQICEFVSKTFYKGTLQTDPNVQRLRDAASGVAKAIMWVDYASIFNAEVETGRNGKSKANPTEMNIIMDMFATDGFENFIRHKSVMLITFYKEQSTLLKDKMKAASIKFNTEDSNLRIVTVDAAQGSEADVVVLSTVRCNSSSNIGFLDNENRMCVAVSRARERLIVVGNSRTLSKNNRWNALIRQSTVVDSKNAKNVF